MTTKTLALIEGDQNTNTNAQLGAMQAVAVTVDNYSGSFLTIPAAGRSCPPWRSGWTVGLTGPHSVGQAVWGAPTGVRGTPVPSTPGRATIVWSDAPLPQDNGVPINQPSTLAQTLDTGTIGSNPQTADVAIPTGTQSLAVGLSSHVPVSPESISIVGDTSGIDYYTGSIGNTPVIVPLIGGEQSVTVTFTGVLGGTTFTIAAVFASETAQPLPITGLLSGALPGVESSAGITVYAVNHDLNGSTLHLTPNTCNLRGCQLGYFNSSLHGGVALEDGGGNVLWQAIALDATHGGPSGTWPDFDGHRVVAGSGLQFPATGASCTIFGVVYTDNLG